MVPQWLPLGRGTTAATMTTKAYGRRRRHRWRSRVHRWSLVAIRSSRETESCILVRCDHTLKGKVATRAADVECTARHANYKRRNAYVRKKNVIIFAPQRKPQKRIKADNYNKNGGRRASKVTRTAMNETTTMRTTTTTQKTLR